MRLPRRAQVEALKYQAGGSTMLLTLPQGYA